MIGYLIVLFLGAFIGYYGGSKDFRQKLNKWIGSLVHKALESQGNGDKKKIEDKKDTK